MIEPVQQHKSKPKLVTSLKPIVIPTEPTVKPVKTWQTVKTVTSPQYNAIVPPIINSTRNNGVKSTKQQLSMSPQPIPPKRTYDRYSSLAQRSHSSSNNVSSVNSPLVRAESIVNSPVQLGTAANAIQLHQLQQQSLSDSDSDIESNTYSNYNAVLNSIQSNVQSSVDTIRTGQRSRIPSTSSDNSIRNSSSRHIHANKHIVADESSSDEEDVQSSQFDMESDDSDTENNQPATPNEYERVLSLDRIEPTTVAIERRKKLKKFGDAALDGRLYRTDISQSIRDTNTGLLLSLAPLPAKVENSDKSTTVQLEPIELKLYPQKLHENTDTTITTLGKELTSLLTNTGTIKCSNCHTVGHYSKQCRLANKQRTNSVISSSTDSNNTDLPTTSTKRSGNVASSTTLSIQINNLPPETTKQDIHDLCIYFGRPKRITVPVDKYGNCKGVAYVTFVRSNDATKALNELDRYAYGGCVLNVTAANTY